MNIKSFFKTGDLSVRMVKAVCVSKSAWFMEHGETGRGDPLKPPTPGEGGSLCFMMGDSLLRDEGK